MNHKLSDFSVFVLMLTLLTLSSCNGMTVTPSVAGQEELLVTPAQLILPCEACDQATLAAALTQEKFNTENQAAATAEIVRANAQATLNSANATLSAALTQEQNTTNIIVAQIAATAEVARANAQATLFSAGSTQSAAFTQDSIRQTQMADMATTSAQSLLIQQNNDALAAGTQTAVANTIATQTQSAAATSQWYTDQTRQRDEQRQGPIAFLWMWCFPSFVVLSAIFVLWAIWRWQKLQQVKQRVLENPVEKLQPPMAGLHHRRQDNVLFYVESDVVDDGYQVTTPDDHVSQWMNEVKTKLLDSDKKDEDDSTNN
ncbi:MAG: hypothetical protein AABZ00_00060 [Chloroflexota bacterium]